MRCASAAGVLRCIERQRDVLGDGQRFEQREMLEHHADAEPTRRGWTVDRRPADLPIRCVPASGRVTP